MSKIDKLAILGVRSFDNIRSETIQFHAPLTLIVGHNGSGKTTIIECLKYATTGDLPPNSKGGAFIHDPKLCGEKEVLAQVKLSFKGTSGAKMVATRSLQLTVKKATRVQKTLEGQLLMIKDGERTSLSSRVAELDQIMPQYLGVSRAVLDSVIFCHQDESLWPMSEPSVLKKKFDEIFEALKYTKAIDNIKTLRKKQNEELAKHLINEGHAKVDKDRADKAEKRSQELSQELDVLRGEVEALTTEIKAATAEMDHLFKHAAGFEKVIGTLSGKRIAAQTKRESIQRARQYMKEMNESDDVLTARLEKYEEMVATCQQQVVSQKVQYTTIIDQVEQTRHQLSMKLSEKGKFESEKDNHERQLAKRKSLVTETARRHKIRGFETDLNDDLIRGFMEKIGKLLREQKLNLEKTRQTTREELQEAQNELTRLREQKSVILQAKDYAKREITLNDRKILSFQHEMNSIEFDEGMKSVFDTAVDDIHDQLRKAKKVFDDSRWDQNITESTKRLEEAEVEHEKLNQELVQSIRHAGNAAKAQFLQKELKDRQKSLDTMIAAHGEKIAQAVGSNWEPATLERSFSSILGQKREETQSAVRQRDGTDRELEQLDFKLSTSHATLKRMHMEMASCEQKVREATDDGPDEYEGVVSQLERDRDVLKADFDSFKNLKDYFTKCKATAEENSVCRLCTRQFKNEKEMERFIKRLDEQIMKSAQQTASDELKEIEEELKRAREARPSFDVYVRLSKWEIPKVDSELKDLQIQRENVLRRIESQDKSVSHAEASKSDVESLTKTVQIISKYFTEIVSFHNQAKELAMDHDSSISRSVDDIEKEQSVEKEKIASVRAMLQKVTAKRDESQTQIHKLELELRDQETKLSTATYQLDKKRDLVSRVDELRMASNTQHMKIEEADKKFEELAPKSLNAQAKYDDVYQRGTEKENQQQRELSSLSDSVYQLDHADQEINGYIERGGAHELSRCEEDIQKHSQVIRQLEKELNEIATEVKVIESNLSQSEETKRAIGENLRFREDQRDLLFLTNEIADLEAQNAERDRARFAHEAEKMGFRVQTLSADRSSKMGTMKSKDDELRRLVKEWETDYKDAAQNFKKAHIMAETTKAAVEDLGRYGSALDKAIMAYHSLKMEEINRIIQELWQKTYQGTDVDGILIKSDNETAKGNRSYNYRVCMVKQDAEMDMRGRCSAGQKVLACIIIRLALAECFGVNCGLIALDEPTTNLDRDNIRALAESLHEIIKTRQAQSNFQLIVITHDEEFLRNMKCGDFADTYYRVSRNERQKSQIERQGIGGVI